MLGGNGKPGTAANREITEIEQNVLDGLFHIILQALAEAWKDVVRTTCYLRDMERDYAAFNEGRTAFFAEQELDPLPASTAIEAVLCRPELLVEMLNRKLHPTVPSQGSVGASGDLAPLSHLALAMIGEGDVKVPSPITLEAKEGLAFVNGTQAQTGLAALLVIWRYQRVQVTR